MTRLMHCPWCGSDEVGHEVLRASGATSGPGGTQWATHTYAVVCDKCKSRGPSETSINMGTAREAARTSWNMRLSIEEDTAMRIAFALTPHPGYE